MVVTQEKRDDDGQLRADEPPAVRMTGLRKRYGKVTAVDGVDLVLPVGQVVALLGPNGAGKSTTIDMMLGLSRPDEGVISLYGGPMRSALDDGMAGAMLQNSQLPEDVTVRELVGLYAALHRRPIPVPVALERAGIAELAKRRTSKLSGGQQQRVRFALAIVCDPRLLVLDEPTAGMDVRTRREFWAAMRALTGSGRTILFATHYLDEADEFADRVVLMSAGRIIADGPATEIKATVSGRQLAATVSGSPDPGVLARLSGVDEAKRAGDRITLRCRDSDAAVRALLVAHPDARDIEITALGLEEAFLALTTEDQ